MRRDMMDYSEVAKICAYNLLEAGIIREDEVPLAVKGFTKLDPKDLIVTLIETHYLRNNRITGVYPLPDVRKLRN